MDATIESMKEYLDAKLESMQKEVSQGQKHLESKIDDLVASLKDNMNYRFKPVEDTQVRHREDINKLFAQDTSIRKEINEGLVSVRNEIDLVRDEVKTRAGKDDGRKGATTAILGVIGVVLTALGLFGGWLISSISP